MVLIKTPKRNDFIPFLSSGHAIVAEATSVVNKANTQPCENIIKKHVTTTSEVVTVVTCCLKKKIFNRKVNDI